MFKKLTAVLSAAILLLGLCACSGGADKGGTTEPESSTGAVDYKTDDGKYLDSVAVSIFKNKKALCTYNGTEYYAADYQGKHIVAKNEKNGSAKILFEYPAETKLEFFSDTYERSGKVFLYFTKQVGGSDYSALCAYYLPNMTEMSIAPTPCSNFVILDVPASYEMHTYGFIATGSVINVINLADGSISASYSKTLTQLSSYIKMPDSFFGSGVTTTLEQADRAHLRVKVMNGEKVKQSLLFNCALGVATLDEEK